MTQALKTLEINRGIEEFKKTPNAVLFDVRRPEEYAQGRIAGSKNVSVQMAAKILEQVPDKETPIFLYCLSGARSRRAAAFLQREGYEKFGEHRHSSQGDQPVFRIVNIGRYP